jgi:hypothetical protein
VQLVGLMEAIALPAILATLWKAGLGRALGIVIGSLAIFTAVVAYAGRGDDSPAAAILLTAVNFFALASVLLTSFALVLLHTLLRRRWWLLPPAVLATPLLLAGIHEGIQISSTEASRFGLLQAVVMAGLVLVLALLPVLIAIRTTRGSVAFRSLRELCTGRLDRVSPPPVGAAPSRTEPSSLRCRCAADRLADDPWRPASSGKGQPACASRPGGP